MSTTTLTFTVLKDAVLTDVTSVVLADPTATYGVKRNDTNGIVVAANTPMVRISAGTYEYSFEDPASDLVYGYYVKVTDGENISYFERESSNPPEASIMPSGAYATVECIKTRFGEDNVAKWAELDINNTASKTDARLDLAIQDAEEYINDVLRDGPYVIPFSSPVPVTIKNLACRLAGVILYEARGIQDFDPVTGEPVHKLAWHRKYVEQMLARIKSGRIKLTTATYTRIPKVFDAGTKSEEQLNPPPTV